MASPGTCTYRDPCTNLVWGTLLAPPSAPFCTSPPLSFSFIYHSFREAEFLGVFKDLRMRTRVFAHFW